MASLQESPQSAWRLATAPDGSPAPGEPQKIDRSDVRLGDLIFVKAGEQVEFSLLPLTLCRLV